MQILIGVHWQHIELFVKTNLVEPFGSTSFGPNPASHGWAWRRIFHMHCNFARIHKALRVTPAVEAGLPDHVWSIEKIAALIPEPKANKRGPYKKHAVQVEFAKPENFSKKISS